MGSYTNDPTDPTEAAMVKALTEAARAGGWLYHHVQRSDYGRQMGLRGFPDLFLVHPDYGRAVALEVKAKRGVVTPEQKEWADALTKAGVRTYFVWPKPRAMGSESMEWWCDQLRNVRQTEGEQ